MQGLASVFWDSLVEKPWEESYSSGVSPPQAAQRATLNPSSSNGWRGQTYDLLDPRLIIVRGKGEQQTLSKHIWVARLLGSVLQIVHFEPKKLKE